MTSHGGMLTVSHNGLVTCPIVMSHVPLFSYDISRCVTNDKHICNISLEITAPVHVLTIFSLIFSYLIRTMKIN